jgi:hypothetical protein
MAGLFSSETEGVGLVYGIVEDESILDDIEARWATKLARAISLKCLNSTWR